MFSLVFQKRKYSSKPHDQNDHNLCFMRMRSSLSVSQPEAAWCIICSELQELGEGREIEIQLSHFVSSTFIILGLCHQCVHKLQTSQTLWHAHSHSHMHITHRWHYSSFISCYEKHNLKQKLHKLCQLIDWCWCCCLTTWLTDRLTLLWFRASLSFCYCFFFSLCRNYLFRSRWSGNQGVLTLSNHIAEIWQWNWQMVSYHKSHVIHIRSVSEEDLHLGEQLQHCCR